VELWTGQRILVVEDNAINQRVIVSMLEELGFSVRVAENGEAGVALAMAQPFDLVLMDQMMPVMDGLAATREIRRREGDFGRRANIVALTAATLDEERARCLEAGMDDFLAKPFRREELLRMLRTWVPLDRESTPHQPATPTPRAVARLAERPDGRHDTYPARDQREAVREGVDKRRETSGAWERIEDVDDTLDETALDTIRSFPGGEQILRDAVRALLETMPARLEELRRAAHADDREAVRSLSHSLKSTTRMLGARRLALLLQRLEQTSQQATRDALLSLVEEVGAHFATVQSPLAALAMGAAPSGASDGHA
jgi:CheY-like chemotaxis protein/HPt (histidine-containing phosphotransfer) domain-containing protein